MLVECGVILDFVFMCSVEMIEVYGYYEICDMLVLFDLLIVIFVVLMIFVIGVW